MGTTIDAKAIRQTPFYRKLRKLVLKQEEEQGYGCGLADTLANLRHLADELSQDFAGRDRAGYDHYLAEIAGRE